MRTRRVAFAWARVIALIFIFLSGYLCLGGGPFKSPGVSADASSQTRNVNVVSAATVAHFNASVTDEGVLLRWKTGFEADNLGFNLYRDQNGRRTRVNPQMIAGSALMTGATLRAGRSYAWLDKSNDGGDGEYWLEEVDLDGQREWHGPVRAARSIGEPDGPERSREQSLMLSRVGATEAPAPLSAARERAATLSKTTEAGLRAQASATSRNAVKLAVKREGWYRVTQAELIGAGFDPEPRPPINTVIRRRPRATHRRDG